MTMQDHPAFPAFLLPLPATDWLTLLSGVR